jgi:predicted  nucleic acid-binding Zn-ribbon protein
LAKLQKDYEMVSRERNKLREEVEQLKVNLEESNLRFADIKKKVESIDNERRSI